MRAVRDDRGRPTERVGVEPLHAPGTELHEPFRQADRHVDERRANGMRPREEHQRDAHGVDRREHDVGPVERAERRENCREVAAVPSGALEAALQGRTRRPCPRRRLRSLEVVADGVSALGELIQPVEHVACRRARLELERRAPLRGVPEEVVERGHQLPPVR